MARRNRKTSPFKPLLFWTCALAVAGWGLWQGNQIWHAVDAEATTRAAPLTDDAGGSGGGSERASRVIPIRAGGAAGGDSAANDTMPAYTIDGADPQPDPSADAAGRSLPDDLQRQLAPVFDPALSADALRTTGMKYLVSGETVRARYTLNAALDRCTDETLSAVLRDTLRGLNEPVFMGTAILPDDMAARLIEIQPGDSFLKLAHDFAVPATHLEAINPALNPRNLRPLAGIKIIEGPFHAHIIKHASRLDLYARDMYVRSFPVEFPEGNSLPTGDYRVAQDGKIKLAGSKTWIEFEGLEPVTEAVTAGWIFGSAGPRGTSAKDRETGIRLADADLARLYNLLVERRSHIRVER